MSTSDPATSAETDGLDGLDETEDVSGIDAEEASAPIPEANEELDPFAELARERDEYLDALRRLQAEFDNYRKRVTKQQTELGARASERLLEQLLPTLDALDLASAHALEPGGAESSQLAAALVQIAALLRDTLAKEGLERIDSVDVEFDPTVHDAVAHDDAEEAHKRGVLVTEVLRPGYRLKGRVVRPAMVRVRG